MNLRPALFVVTGLAAALGLPSPAGAQDTPGANRETATTADTTDTVLRGEELPVVEETLENGLRLLVLPRPGSSTVSFVVRYDVGSVHERRGNTGVAHLLEHLLFKGTTTVGTRNLEAELRLFDHMDRMQDSIVTERARRPRPDTARIRLLRDSIRILEDSARTFAVGNELDRVLAENGARNVNATTEHEGTTYFAELPANRAELWFALEADRMTNPVFREFYSERDVVAEERRSRLEDSPGGRLSREHLATVFQVHPYEVPVIGYMSDIRNLTREQVRAYHRTYYGARNAVVAVVGGVDPEQVLEWARAYLGRVPRGRPPEPVLTEEPEQNGERRIRVRVDAEPQLLVGWRVPDGLHPDAPALQVLSTLLAGGRTSRLQRRLVQEDGLAGFVGASVGPGQLDPRVFSVHLVPRSPHTPEELERALYEELDRLRRNAPEETELQKVRNQLEAGRVRRLASGLGLAYQLAVSESLYGDWRATFEHTLRLQEVTADDVRRVVGKWFVPEKRTVATLVRPEAEEAVP